METWRSQANPVTSELCRGRRPVLQAAGSRARHRRKVSIHRQAQVAGSGRVGALMEYVITTAFLVGVVVAGFGTAIFTGYEVARFVASAM